MKIVRLVSELNFGGVEQRLVNVSRIKDGNEWLFCALGKGGAAAEAIIKNNCRVNILEKKYKIPNFSVLFALISFFKREKPDVVHTSGAEANFHGIIAARIAGVGRIVGEEIGIPGQGKLANWIFSVVYTLADAVIANSKVVGEYLESKNGVSVRKLRIVANPLGEIPSVTLPATSGNRFEMLTVSRLEAVKNIEGVLEILPELLKTHPNIKLTIIGKGGHEKVLRKVVNVLFLDGYVDFIGYQENPFGYLKEVDLFVLNSHTEGFSNALAEAMLHGIPCLATKVGAASEMILDGETGWLVEPGQSEMLKRKMLSILNLKKAELTEIGKKGKSWIASNYSLDRHIHELLKIYRSS
jgi:glycosyltransferase involved in cell wall biosynthesis